MKKQGSGARGQGSEKTQNPLTITVKAALRELGKSSWLGVAEFLQVQTYEERKKIRQTLVDLVKAGLAKYEGKEDYSLCDNPGRVSVQAKLWEFACHRFFSGKPFTAAEAARLAECNLDYTKRYCRWLFASGYLTKVARARAGAGARFYRVMGGREHESAPAWNRRAENRKSAGQAPTPAVLPARDLVEEALQAGKISPAQYDWALEYCRRDPEGFQTYVDRAPELVPEELQKFAANMRQAFADFYRGMRHLAAHFPQVKAVLLEMEEDLDRIMKEQGHDEPGKPTESHH